MKYYLGIDLGGTNIKAGIVDETGAILHKQSIKTFGARPYEEIINDMADLCHTVTQNANISWEQVEAIGIGVPGAVNQKDGMIVYTNNLNLTGVPAGKMLAEKLQKPVYLGNDASCAALGEFVSGSAKEYNSIILVTLGTGVGGGIILNGKLWEGFNGAGGEIGHMVIHSGGEPCSCGRQGCWEAYSSATALIRDTKRAMEEHPESYLHTLLSQRSKISAKTAFDAVKKGDKTAKEVVDRYLFHLSEGLANISNIFEPDAIILGGGVCNEGDALLVPLKELVAPKFHAGDRLPHADIKIASLGNDAGIVGAAMLWNA